MILVVDDDKSVRYTLREILEADGHEVVEAADGVEALARCGEQAFALVITDLRMPRLDGMELLRKLQGTRVVMITAHGAERQAVEAMKAGAWDFFRKPFDTEELRAVVRRALAASTLQSENDRLRGELVLSGSMVLASEPMHHLATLVTRIAPRHVTVLIQGESGTGKERVAEAIWRASQRADKPFVRFNCAALAPELIDGELFGHAKGAFTGAVRARAGLFAEADGGTLLLDEVGELHADAQTKLLRVLQEGEVRAVGEDKPRRVDVRIIAATHRDLRERIGAGAFREDLFYRLNVVTLRVPALRERSADIEPLTRYFMQRFARSFGVTLAPVPDALFERVRAYAWPGNVRELEHAIESMVALSPDGTLDLSLLPCTAEAAPLTLKQRVDAYERGLVMEALNAAGGNRTQAARDLGVSRVTLHDKLNKYGVS